MSNPDLSVVLPAYNEAKRLGPTLEKVVAYLAGRSWTPTRSDGDAPAWEVIVVDDGSTDGTAALVETHPVGRRAAEAGGVLRLLVQPENRGKGAALRRGVGESRGRRVLLSDADLSTPVEDIERLEPVLDAGAQLALGSRALARSRITVRQPLYRELMGKTFNRIIRLLGVRGIRDTQCGFKLLDGAAARLLFERVKTDGFAFDVELVWLARRGGYRIEEVPVRWANSADSRVDPVLDSLRMLRDVLLLRWRHRGEDPPPGPEEVR